MKLIDLLVKELPERGGWPEAINFKSEFISQDSSGDLWCYPTKPGFNSSRRWLVKGGHGSSIMRAELSSDHATSVVTREQYEAALADSQKPVWNGEGLPPVGTECEWRASIYHNYVKVKILAYHEDEVWLQPLNGADSFTVGNPDDFRPIRTEAERKREQTVNNIAFMLEACEHRECTAVEAAKYLYDAIAAGKIPGIKLDTV
ncbi:MAG: hypothetical protein [Siphoviridae sp. ctdc_1]|nr:MAG: hypothetical protein [Siphoviridae sp. ctdc_1]